MTSLEVVGSTREVSEKGNASAKHAGHIQCSELWLIVSNSERESLEQLRWWTQESQLLQKMDLHLLLTVQLQMGQVLLYMVANKEIKGYKKNIYI